MMAGVKRRYDGWHFATAIIPRYVRAAKRRLLDWPKTSLATGNGSNTVERQNKFLPGNRCRRMVAPKVQRQRRPFAYAN